MMSSLAAANNGNRFSPISPHDHAGYLWIAGLLAGIYSVLAIFLRMYIKRNFFGADDWTCAAATAVSVGSFVAIYVGLKQGLGKSIRLVDATDMQDIGQSTFASRILLIVATCLAKCSTVLLIRRLFSQDMQIQRNICGCLIAIIALWGLGSIISISVSCNTRDLLQPAGHCGSQLTRWQIIGINDGVTELLIVVLSFGLIYRLQMRMHLKARVILAFIFRLPLVPLAIVHIHLIGNALRDGDLSLSMIPALIIEQVILGYSLISATIPNLKSFIMSFDTALMMEVSRTLGSVSQPTPIPSEPASTERAGHASDSEQRDRFIRRLRSERRKHSASVKHDGRWSMSGSDISLRSLGGTSQDKIIRRDVHWDVEESFALCEDSERSLTRRSSSHSQA